MDLPKSMWAGVCERQGQPLTMKEIAVPRPGAGEIVVKLESCGVCHTDLHLRDGDEPLGDNGLPLTLGHEGVGRVAALGPGVTGLCEGDRVGLPWLYETCCDCKPCLGGAETFCPEQQARGMHRNGAFAEYALARADFACRLPDALDPIRFAPVLCAGLTAWGAIRKTGLRPGTSCMVIGCGGLGQYAIELAVAHGAHVIAVDRDAAKLDTARRLGAHSAVAAGPEAAEQVRSLGGAEVCLNFAPTPAVWEMIEGAVNPMSEIVAVALVQDPVPLSMMWLIDGGHRVLGSSVGSRQELRDLVAYAETRPFSVETESIALNEVNTALDRLRTGAVRGRVVIDFSR